MTNSEMRERLLSAGHLPPTARYDLVTAYNRMAQIQWLYAMGYEVPSTYQEVARVYRGYLAPFRARDVYAALKIKGRIIPPEMQGRFDVEITSEHYRSYSGPLIVRAATGAYAKHRIFVPCCCGAEVPFGRVAQHKCK